MSIDRRLRRHSHSHASSIGRLLLGLPSVLGCLALVAGLQAGEAIQFAPGKSKVAPELDFQLSKEKASGPGHRLKLGANGLQGDGVLMPSLNASPTRSRSEEKKLKNEEMEKKNWMILDRGELQKKDEEGSELGVRDYGASIEGDRTAGDIWFGPNRGKAPTASPRASRAPSAPSRAPGPSAGRPASEDRPTEETPRGTPREGQTPGQQVTASLRDVDAQSSLASDQKDAGMRDVFSGRSASGGTDNRREESGLRPASGPGNSQPILGRGYGLGREGAPGSLLGPPSSPILDGRRSAVSGPGSAPSAVSRGFGSGVGSSFGSDQRGPFSSPSSGFNNNNQRNEFAPGSSRSTFETPVRR